MTLAIPFNFPLQDLNKMPSKYDNHFEFDKDNVKAKCISATTARTHMRKKGINYKAIQGWGCGHIVLELGFVQGRLLGELGAQVLVVRLTPEAERMSWTTHIILLYVYMGL